MVQYSDNRDQRKPLSSSEIQALATDSALSTLPLGAAYGYISWCCIERREELVNTVRSAGELGPLVDLGSSVGYSENAKQMGFKRYVGVDLFLNFSKNENVTKELGFPAIEIQPGYELRVNADMLLFLQKMPDSCCSIAIDGIDRFVIQMEKYHAAVAEQIMRVVQPGGVVFGTNSRALDCVRPPAHRFQLNENSAKRSLQ